MINVSDLQEQLLLLWVMPRSFRSLILRLRVHSQFSNYHHLMVAVTELSRAL